MSITAILLQTFAIYYLVMGIGLITNWNIMHKIIREFQKERGLTFLMGAWVTLLGSFLITIHTLWDTYPQLIATILVWIIFAKGVSIVLFPEMIKRQLKSIFKNKAWYYAMVILVPALAISCGFLSILA